jgi:hypothetical protein
LAAETERAVAETYVPLNGEAAQRHANELLRLGEIRVRLGEDAEAERVLDEAATAFWKLGSSLSHRERAAVARVTQASLASVAGRFDDALAIIDALVEQVGVFPSSRNVQRPALSGSISGCLRLSRPETTSGYMSLPVPRWICSTPLAKRRSGL